MNCSVFYYKFESVYFILFYLYFFFTLGRQFSNEDLVALVKLLRTVVLEEPESSIFGTENGSSRFHWNFFVTQKLMILEFEMCLSNNKLRSRMELPECQVIHSLGTGWKFAVNVIILPV
jgi:hypothetical protein